MASAPQAEMAALYITARKMIPLRNKLIELVWQQAKTPIQTDNLTVVWFTNKKIVRKATNSADMNLWWLRDRESQEKIQILLGTKI